MNTLERKLLEEYQSELSQIRRKKEAIKEVMHRKGFRLVSNNGNTYLQLRDSQAPKSLGNINSLNYEALAMLEKAGVLALLEEYIRLTHREMEVLEIIRVLET